MMMSAAFSPGGGSGKGKILRSTGAGAPNASPSIGTGPADGKWAGVVGLAEAIHEALEPLAASDPYWSPEEVEKRVSAYITKAAQKYRKHEMATQRGTAVQAQALIEEFVDAAMNAVSAGCYDRQWFVESNFAGPLLAAAAGTFHGCKLFARTLVPVLKTYVEDGLFSWREDERIQKSMWEAIAESGLEEKQHKKANAHLQKAYDEAHLGSAYGTSIALSPELGLLQDFMQGWMKEFVERAWEFLTNAIASSKEETIAYVVALFQKLADPEVVCLPHGLVTPLEGSMPPAGWSFIMETAYAVCAEVDAEPPAKKPKTWDEGGNAAAGWGGGGKKKKGWKGGPATMTAAGANGAASAGHPECTNAQACIGDTSCQLVRHLIDESTSGDVYCKTCWDAVVGARPELLCEFI